MRQLAGLGAIAATAAVILTAVSCGGEARGIETVFFPPEIEAPPWLEARRQAQLLTSSGLGVFHDFTFSDRLEESGIRFRHRMTDDGGRYHKEVHYDHGSGVAVADVDGDGRYDLYFVNQVGDNELWRNLGGGKFEETTQAAGVAVAEHISVAASFADIDNDGDPDLYVTTVRGGNFLFENDGAGRFADVSAQSGLFHRGHSSGAIFFDFDRDGLLDLFLTNVGEYTADTLVSVTNDSSTEQDGVQYVCYLGYDDAFTGHLNSNRLEQSILYKNLGGGRFVDVSEETGLQDAGWSGDVSTLDVNEDGWPDLYVPNMQGDDRYYENVNGKRFVDRSRAVFPKTPWGAMGIKVFDYNNDGDMDIFITDMHSDMVERIGPELEKLKARAQFPEEFLRTGGTSIFGNAFYENRGDQRFEEVSDKIGAENYWPWGVSVGDLNADGYEDVFITASMNYPYRYGVNSLLLNDRGDRLWDSEFILGVEPRRDGRTAAPWFEVDCDDKTQESPPCEGRSGRLIVWGALGSRSSAIFDVDDDGDLDIVTNDFNSEPMVLISNLTERKDVRFLKVRLIGTESNRSGLGATVMVRAGEHTYTRVHDGKSGYLGQSLFPLYFGLDDAEYVDQVEVHWPSGWIQVIPGPIRTNTLLEIKEQ